MSGNARLEPTLQRLFSTFPGGWPALGLLLLRAAVGLSLMVQGGAYLVEWGQATSPTWALGLVAVATGGALLIGFLTPLAGVVAAVGGVGVALSWLPAPTPNVIAGTLATVLVGVVGAAVALLGPGAFSLDACLFGRREVVIPRASSPPSED